MKVRLIERGPTPDKTREFLVTSDFLIGRGSDCDLRLPESSISRHHCNIHIGGTEVVLADLGSSNGTFLNGQRLRSQLPLHSGDEIQVGTSSFLVDLGDRAFLELESSSAPEESMATLKLRKPPEKKNSAKEKESP